MPTNKHESVEPWRPSAAAAFALLTYLFVAGCASTGGDSSSAKNNARMTDLADSLEPLREQFNADKEKLRALALLSPT